MRKVWVVESRRPGGEWAAFNTWATDAERDRAYLADKFKTDEWRVVEYTPKGGEEESDGGV